MSTAPEVRYITPMLTDEQVAHVQSFGIPVDTSHPSYYWIGSLMRESAMPTDAELRMIRSFIEFEVRNRYNETWQEKALNDHPFPLVSGHVTKVFRKGAMWLNQPDPLEGWVYRRSTWEGGFSPQWPAPRLTLEQVLDRVWARIEGEGPVELSPYWVKWKTEHPDIFPV